MNSFTLVGAARAKYNAYMLHVKKYLLAGNLKGHLSLSPPHRICGYDTVKCEQLNPRGKLHSSMSQVNVSSHKVHFRSLFNSLVQCEQSIAERSVTQ